MSKSVGVLGVRQRWSEKPYRHITRQEARFGLRTRRFRRVNDVTVAELPPPDTDGVLGIGNAIPFSRVANPIVAPHKLHYAIPHAGDVGLRRHLRTMLEVSHRLAPEIRQLEDIEWFRRPKREGN